MKYFDLEGLIIFMYQGEVNTSLMQSHLNNGNICNSPEISTKKRKFTPKADKAETKKQGT